MSGIGWDWPSEDFKNNPKKLKRHRSERSKNGFSTFDWWSFDTYIAGVIGRAVAKFRDDGVGYPGDMTPESFNKLCTEISEPLIEYSDHKFSIYEKSEKELGMTYSEFEELQYHNAVKAMVKFSETLGVWWD